MVYTKTLLFQTRTDNQGNKNEGQVRDTTIAGLKSFIN